MNTATGVLAAGFAAEAVLGAARFDHRKMAFALARARANQLGRPLVVIGDPSAGAQTRLFRAYGCGDITIDLNGAPSCPRSIAADITKRTSLDSDSGVVFVSCVFEYVSDAQAAYDECLRIAGSRENLFVVRVQPYTFTAYLYPGAKWVMHLNADGTPRFEPVSGLEKFAVVAAVAATGYYAFRPAPSLPLRPLPPLRPSETR